MGLVYKQGNKKLYKAICIIMVVINCYLRIENDKDLKFRMNSLSYSLFSGTP